MTFRSLLFAFLVAVASPAAAQVWHWHTIDYEALRTGRVLWIAHARVEEDGTFLVQARVGARAAVRIKPGIDWTAGYYYGREHSKDEPWRTVNRVFTGPEIRLAKRGPATFRFRSWVEGFVREGRQDYVRFRERLHVRRMQEIRRPVREELSVELIDHDDQDVRLAGGHGRILEGEARF